MKRIFYFHGLESKQGGQKIDFLTRHNLIHAPKMVYAQEATWPDTLSKVDDIKPDIIIGSSMGGLMGFYTGYNRKNCRLLLFNPAFSMREDYIGKWQCLEGGQQAQIRVILGKNDEQIDPKGTIQYLQRYGIKADIRLIEIEHKVPYQILVQEVDDFLSTKNKAQP